MWVKHEVNLIPLYTKSVESDTLVFGCGNFLFMSRKADDIGRLVAQSLIFTPSDSDYEDNSITVSDNVRINSARPSKEWIRYFIKEYNKGNIIKEVYIEFGRTYTVKNINGRGKTVTYQLSIVLNFDNTVNIKENNPVLSEKAVKQLCWQAYINHLCIDGEISIDYANAALEPFEKWYKENTKKNI